MKRSSLPSESSKRYKSNLDEYITSPIASFQTGIKGIICAAFNHDRNLILIANGRLSTRPVLRFIIENITINIFTVQGYFVTTKRLEDNYTREISNPKFTDHMIIMCIQPCRFLILTDFSLKLPYSLHRASFVELDEKGDIYTNGGKSNEILVYSQNLEFKRKFELNLPLPSDSVIVSLHIRADILVVESSLKPGHTSVYTIHRFALSSSKMVESSPFYLEFPLRVFASYVDQFRNICISARNGIYISNKGCDFRRIKFGRLKINRRIFLTNEFQIILICANGAVEVYQLHHSVDI